MTDLGFDNSTGSLNMTVAQLEALGLLARGAALTDISCGADFVTSGICDRSGTPDERIQRLAVVVGFPTVRFTLTSSTRSTPPDILYGWVSPRGYVVALDDVAPVGVEYSPIPDEMPRSMAGAIGLRPADLLFEIPDAIDIAELEAHFHGGPSLPWITQWHSAGLSPRAITFHRNGSDPVVVLDLVLAGFVACRRNGDAIEFATDGSEMLWLELCAALHEAASEPLPS